MKQMTNVTVNYVAPDTTLIYIDDKRIVLRKKKPVTVVKDSVTVNRPKRIKKKNKVINKLLTALGYAFVTLLMALMLYTFLFDSTTYDYWGHEGNEIVHYLVDSDGTETIIERRVIQ